MTEKACSVDVTTGEITERSHTADELALLEQIRDREAAAETHTANEATVRDRLEAALPQLKAGTDALQAGTLFQAASAQERAYLRLLGRTVAGLVKLELRELDSAD